MTTRLIAAALILASACLPAAAQTLVTDQTPIPFTGGAQSEALVQSYAVPGGTLTCATAKPAGAPANSNGTVPALGVGCAFVPGGGGSITRYLPLIDGHSDAGVPMTATPGTPSGTPGVSRTAGTSLVLTGVATSSNATTGKVIWEFNLPATYVAGANIPVIVNANYTGSGTITGVSTTIAAQFYTETAGVEAAVTTSAAQAFTGTATNYTFTVTGTGLVPGQHVMLEVIMLVTTASGANTGQINSVAYGA